MADWWSYGVILYEMISGYTPFGSAAEDDTDVFRDILHTKIRSGSRRTLFDCLRSITRGGLYLIVCEAGL